MIWVILGCLTALLNLFIAAIVGFSSSTLLGLGFSSITIIIGFADIALERKK